MNEKPFKYVGGEFHYFRALPQTWARKLRNMRAAGLNVVSTYVEWSLHNPKENSYVWDGIADLVKFITIAESEDLYVILRPGPYICAERDMVRNTSKSNGKLYINLCPLCRVDFLIGCCINIHEFNYESMIQVIHSFYSLLFYSSNGTSIAFNRLLE